MKIVIGLCFFISLAFSHDWNRFYPMPEDSNVSHLATNDSLLGICYGSSTLWSQYPYVVALRYPSGYACCSASIISLNPGVLLTAAHCEGCTGTVRIGCNNPETCDGDSYTIANIVVHPDYPGTTGFSSDLAIIHLTSPITTGSAVAVNIGMFAKKVSFMYVCFSEFGLYFTHKQQPMNQLMVD